jgi:Fungal N-terminal domain of STAND proteins
MDPLSLTASVITVATLAWQSSKAAYDVVDGLIKVLNTIADSKRLLSQTQTTLDTLRDTLTVGTETPDALDSVLQKIKLDIALESARCLCDEFRKTMTRYTSHSTDLRFSNRNRFTVNLHESKITKFNKQLSKYQRTISLVLILINL